MKLTFKRAMFAASVGSIILCEVFESPLPSSGGRIEDYPLLFAAIAFMVLYFIKAIDDDVFAPLRRARAEEMDAMRKRIEQLEQR